ncbi:MAG: NmrA family protein, partial [Labilithrix sp.]|nr:NmrA family protein [Labilithrix sp.]
MILVIGATGTVGGALVRRLASKNVPFRALVRSETKGMALGCPYVVGDLDDARSLARALSGVSRVFLNGAPGAEMGRQQKAAIDAAREAGVAHVVKLSTRGADTSSPMITPRMHAEIEAYLKASGLAWTILQPGFFMQNFFRHADGIKEEGKFFGAFGQGRIAFLDVEDIAKTAAIALTEDSYAGKTLVLTGPELMTHAEAAGCFTEKLGHRVEYIDLPVEQIVGFMIKGGTPPEFARGLGAMMSAMAAGGAAYTSSTVQDVTGERPRTFAD